MAQGSRSKVQDSGFRVQGSRFRVQGSRFRFQGSRSKIQGSGFKVQDSGRQGSRSKLQGSGFKVRGAPEPECQGVSVACMVRDFECRGRPEVQRERALPVEGSGFRVRESGGGNFHRMQDAHRRPFAGVSQVRYWSHWFVFVGTCRQKLIILMEIDF